MEISDSHILKTFRDPSTREEGFKMLMKKYQERLYWQIRRMVIVHEDTDDVLQNVFVKIWKNLGNFQEQSQLFTWLYRIAMNEALTFLNQKKKKATSGLEGAEEIYAQLSADSYFDGEEIQKKLQAAIDTLPEKQKKVFLLRYYEEMPYDKMSQILETSEGALKASFHHAVKKIENFLTEH